MATHMDNNRFLPDSTATVTRAALFTSDLPAVPDRVTEVPWRHAGRHVYATLGDPETPDPVVGIMATPALARAATDDHNRRLPLAPGDYQIELITNPLRQFEVLGLGAPPSAPADLDYQVELTMALPTDWAKLRAMTDVVPGTLLIEDLTAPVLVMPISAPFADVAAARARTIARDHGLTVTNTKVRPLP